LPYPIIKLNRNNLSKICVPYILPLLEYACELWDERCSRNADKLNQLQLEAARIITGLPKVANKESLYFETDWETLSCRRKRRKLTLLVVCIDLKFGSNEFHKRIADEQTSWKIFLNDILVPYIVKNFSDYNCYQLNILEIVSGQNI
jgi:hypothetical protein